MEVPFIDFKEENIMIKEDLINSISKFVDSKWYVLGKEVENFEKGFAEYCGAKFGVGVASGTDALHLALKALDVKEGDEVIMAANSYIATALAVSRTGAKPVLVEIKEDTYNIDPVKIKEKITNSTKVILPVHLYGNSCDIDKICEIAREHNLKIIWDACQAHGVFYKNKNIGSYGDAVCFSFYPSKNLGGLGDGGIVVTDNEIIANKIRTLKNYGQEVKNYSKIIGYNSRLDEIQAAILNVKLPLLDEWNNKRRNNAKIYNELLKDVQEVHIPVEENDCKGNHHLYVVRVKDREKLQEHLKNNGTLTLVHYPYPLYLQETYKGLGHKEGDFPITEKIAKEILSLPISAGISEEQIKYVVDCIKEFYGQK